MAMRRKLQEISEAASDLVQIASTLSGEHQYEVASRWILEGAERDYPGLAREVRAHDKGANPGTDED